MVTLELVTERITAAVRILLVEALAARKTDGAVSDDPRSTKERPLLKFNVGKTTDYCGPGCQATYGTCGDSAIGSPDPDLCGILNKNNKCSDGKCCGTDGYADMTILHVD